MAKAQSATIGVAAQEADGTIVLTLRAEGKSGATRYGQFWYKPADRDYPMVKAHVGPIPPGDSVAAKLFPDR